MKKKIAILTGCEGQLGSLFAKELIELNYHIVGVDIKKKSKNKNIEYFCLDISKEKNIKKLFVKLKKYKKIDLLINNAAQQIFSDFEKRTSNELDKLINVNLKAVILMTKFMFNFYFKKNKSGKIINIGSVYGVVSPNMDIYKKGDRKSSEIYGASKAAIIHLTKYFANYFASYNVDVNCISPGGVYNDLSQSKKFQRRYIKNVPQKRMAFENEIAEHLKFLVRKKDKYLNGQNIIIDGALTSI